MICVAYQPLEFVSLFVCCLLSQKSSPIFMHDFCNVFMLWRAVGVWKGCGRTANSTVCMHILLNIDLIFLRGLASIIWYLLPCPWVGVTPRLCCIFVSSQPFFLLKLSTHWMPCYFFVFFSDCPRLSTRCENRTSGAKMLSKFRPELLRLLEIHLPPKQILAVGDLSHPVMNQRCS